MPHDLERDRLQARHLLLEERVAIKILAPVDGERRAASAIRLLREARASSSLRGPHTVRIRDVERLPDGTPYIVMERLVGMDVAAHLRARPPDPIRSSS